MNGTSYFQLLAQYNEWANARLYTACRELSDKELAMDRGAYFLSIINTLNHILVGDRIWLSRFCNQPPEVTELGSILFADLDALWQARQKEDFYIIELFCSFKPNRFKIDIEYKDTSGKAMISPASICFAHFFNHQTHHRGQVHDMVAQAGMAPPELDLMYYYQGG